MVTLRKKDRNLLKIISDFAKKKKVKLYLVGGYLRDIVLKREKDSPDIDFCLNKGAIKFASQLSKKIKSGLVILDKQHGCCRLVRKIKDKQYTLDFADFRGKTLKEDLAHRDFTINSFAVGLQEAINAKGLDNLFIDPFGSRQDLKLKLIRAVNIKSFDEDPLRILRAFSLAAIFGFKIDKPSLKLIRSKKNKLSVVSYERIRDELFKILDTADAFGYLTALDKLRILKLIIPEIEIMRGVRQGPYHHLNVLAHSLETIRQFEIIIEECKKNKDIRDYLDVVISSQRRRRALIKLGALLHDIGKPQTLRHKDGKTIFRGHERAGSDITKIVAKRLKLSNEEMDCLNKMVFWHLRPGYMADNLRLSARAKFRYFRDTAGEAASVLLLSLADQRSTRGPLTSPESRQRHEKVVSGLIKEYFRKLKEKKLPRLITGDDLIKKFKLPASPLIGKILSGIEELQATGRIKTKQQALKASGILLRKSGGHSR